MHALVDVRTHVNSACMHAGARGSISPLSSYTSAAPALPSHVLHHFLADDNVRGGGLFLLDLGAGAAPPGGDVGGNVSVSDVAAAAFSTGVASGYIHNPEEDGDVIIVTALAGADRGRLQVRLRPRARKQGQIFQLKPAWDAPAQAVLGRTRRASSCDDGCDSGCDGGCEWARVAPCKARESARTHRALRTLESTHVP